MMAIANLPGLLERFIAKLRVRDLIKGRLMSIVLCLNKVYDSLSQLAIDTLTCITVKLMHKRIDFFKLQFRFHFLAGNFDHHQQDEPQH